MKHLSGLDATFLYLETPEMPMHVGSLNLYELPAGYEGDFYEDVKEHIRSRMHLAPLFHKKLAQMPFELANPVWVDDDDVDLDYHIRRIVLSKPGSMRQVEQYTGRLHSRLLDRSRPLWEFYVIEGLASGQVGFYSKVHHAALDGQAGVALANAILDITPQPRKVHPPRVKPAKRPYQIGVGELIGAGLRNVALQSWKTVRSLPLAVKTIAGAVMPQRGEDGKFHAPSLPKITFGPRTPFNVAITNQRAFAGVSMPLADAKTIGKQLGATLNDVVMATVSGALRRYLRDKQVPLGKSLMAAVPVSLRESGEDAQGNQATMILASLASDVADPVKRLHRISKGMASAKESVGGFKAIIPTDFPSLGVPWIMGGLNSLYGRSGLANTLPALANVVISNVPGPQFPLYLAGAKMVTYYPVSIAIHGMALNVTVQSYNGSLEYGLTACRRAVPDIHELGIYFTEAFDELKRAGAAAGEHAGKEAAAEVSARAADSAAEPPAAKEVKRPKLKLKIVKTSASDALAQAVAAAPEPAPPIVTKPARRRTASGSKKKAA